MVLGARRAPAASSQRNATSSGAGTGWARCWEGDKATGQQIGSVAISKPPHTPPQVANGEDLAILPAGGQKLHQMRFYPQHWLQHLPFVPTRLNLLHPGASQAFASLHGFSWPLTQPVRQAGELGGDSLGKAEVETSSHSVSSWHF